MQFRTSQVTAGVRVRSQLGLGLQLWLGYQQPCVSRCTPQTQRSSMDGWLQSSFYFGYMAIISCVGGGGGEEGSFRPSTTNGRILPALPSLLERRRYQLSRRRRCHARRRPPKSPYSPLVLIQVRFLPHARICGVRQLDDLRQAHLRRRQVRLRSARSSRSPLLSSSLFFFLPPPLAEGRRPQTRVYLVPATCRSSQYTWQHHTSTP